MSDCIKAPTVLERVNQLISCRIAPMKARFRGADACVLVRHNVLHVALPDGFN